jgi:hypothetical protein
MHATSQGQHRADLELKVAGEKFRGACDKFSNAKPAITL